MLRCSKMLRCEKLEGEGGGADGRVIVTGTDRKQFFIF